MKQVARPKFSESLHTICKECSPDNQKICNKICKVCNNKPLCHKCAKTLHSTHQILSTTEFINETNSRFSEIYEKCKTMNGQFSELKEGKNYEKEQLAKFWKEDSQFLGQISKKIEEIRESFGGRLKAEYARIESYVGETYGKLSKIAGETINLRDIVKIRKNLEEAADDPNLELKLALSLVTSEQTASKIQEKVSLIQTTLDRQIQNFNKGIISLKEGLSKQLDGISEKTKTQMNKLSEKLRKGDIDLPYKDRASQTLQSSKVDRGISPIIFKDPPKPKKTYKDKIMQTTITKYSDIKVDTRIEGKLLDTLLETHNQPKIPKSNTGMQASPNKKETGSDPIKFNMCYKEIGVQASAGVHVRETQTNIVKMISRKVSAKQLEIYQPPILTPSPSREDLGEMATTAVGDTDTKNKVHIDPQVSFIQNPCLNDRSISFQVTCQARFSDLSPLPLIENKLRVRKGHSPPPVKCAGMFCKTQYKTDPLIVMFKQKMIERHLILEDQQLFITIAKRVAVEYEMELLKLNNFSPLYQCTSEINILLPLVAWPQKIKKTNKVSTMQEMQVCGMCAIFYKLYVQKLNFFANLTGESKQRITNLSLISKNEWEEEDISLILSLAEVKEKKNSRRKYQFPSPIRRGANRSPNSTSLSPNSTKSFLGNKSLGEFK